MKNIKQYKRQVKAVMVRYTKYSAQTMNNNHKLRNKVNQSMINITAGRR